MLIIYNAQYIRLISINSVTQNKTEKQELNSQEISVLLIQFSSKFLWYENDLYDNIQTNFKPFSTIH